MRQAFELVAVCLALSAFALLVREAAHASFDFGIAHYTCPDCKADNNTSEADALWWTCYKCHRTHMPHIGRHVADLTPTR